MRDSSWNSSVLSASKFLSGCSVLLWLCQARAGARDSGAGGREVWEGAGSHSGATYMRQACLISLLVALAETSAGARAAKGVSLGAAHAAGAASVVLVSALATH